MSLRRLWPWIFFFTTRLWFGFCYDLVLLAYSVRWFWTFEYLRLLAAGITASALNAVVSLILRRFRPRWAWPGHLLVLAILLLLLPVFRLPTNYDGLQFVHTTEMPPEDQRVAEDLRLSARKVKLNYEVRRSLLLPLNNSLRRDFFIPQQGVLRLALGLEAKPGAKPVQLGVFLVDPSSGTVSLLVKYLPRDHTAWYPQSVDLSKWGGRSLPLVIQVNSTDPREKIGYVYLSVPEIQSPLVSNHPNVVVVVVDSLRADHLSSFGYPVRETDPHLTEWWRRMGVRFERTTSPANWTTPSVASILTSLYPVQHGANNDLHISLHPGLRSLAEILHDQGFETRAYSLNPLVVPECNFDKGFDVFVDLHNFLFYWQGDLDAMARVTRWLNEEARRPFFLYLHLMDPHMPYTRPVGVHSPGRLRDTLNELRTLQVGTEFPFKAWLFPDPPWSLEQLRGLTLLQDYDREIRNSDLAIHSLFLTLKSRGWLENTLVIVTADHGEEFNEHGGFYHKTQLYEEQVHVPLFVFSSRISGPGRSIPDPVESVDLMPTVLDFLRLAPPDGIEGQSLWPMILSGRGDPNRPVTSELDDRAAKKTLIRSLAVGSEKLICWEKEGEEICRLFDLKQDPMEQKDLAGVDSARALELKKMLHQFYQNLPGKYADTFARQPVTKEQKKMLRSLGYLH